MIFQAVKQLKELFLKVTVAGFNKRKEYIKE